MKKLITSATTITGVLAALPVMAQSLANTVNVGFNYATVVGFGTQELRTTIFLVINIILGFLGIIAVLIILYGGFQWMTAGGDEEKVRSAKITIVHGIFGVAIILAAFAIATFVVSSLVNATT